MNRHKLIAIFVAPFLVLGGYFAAGYFVEQKPPMRTLVSETPCRVLGASCLLVTPGLDIRLGIDKALRAGEPVNVTLNSSAKLDDVLVSFAGRGEKSQPYRLKEASPNQWVGVVNVSDKADIANMQLRLVTGFNGEIYFAEEKIVQ